MTQIHLKLCTSALMYCSARVASPGWTTYSIFQLTCCCCRSRRCRSRRCRSRQAYSCDSSTVASSTAALLWHCLLRRLQGRRGCRRTLNRFIRSLQIPGQISIYFSKFSCRILAYFVFLKPFLVFLFTLQFLIQIFYLDLEPI